MGDILRSLMNRFARRCSAPRSLGRYGGPVLLGSLLAAGAALAQVAPNVSVADLALEWSRGSFATPLVCHIDGAPVRGIRRILIKPGPSHARPRVNRVIFVDLEVDDASRCLTELAGDAPNITGSIEIHLAGRHHPESAQRDFREALRRNKGFEFRVTAGRLRLQKVSRPPSPVTAVDFSGGTARLRELGEGSDAARLLADFRSARKLLLEIEAPDGTRLAFPMYLTADR